MISGLPRRAALIANVAVALTCALLWPALSLAQDQPVLVVDDAQTANPELTLVDVTDQSGLGVGGLALRAPAGYAISVVATNLGEPRFLTFDAGGNLLVAAAGEGVIYRYAFADGLLRNQEALITGLNQPTSVTLFTDGETPYFYVSEPDAISRYAYDASGAVGEREAIIANLPTDGHHTRTVAFGPDGMLYLAVGSSCNICDEAVQLRATVSRANPDGSDLTVIATGLRNPVGLAFQPETDLLWATVNERDNQGNEVPPDLVTIVQEGANYGWPNCLPPDATPQVAGADCAGITPPTIGIQAHSAPLGLAFLVGEGVPASIEGDLLVVQHGSWNRQPPAQPKLLLIDFTDGQPVAAHDLVTGWQAEDGSRWGRPAGVVLAPDGSFIVSDDQAGLLYRIVPAS